MTMISANLFLLAAVSTWIKPMGPVALGAAVAAGVVLGIYGLLRLLLPKIAAIAWTTGKEGVAQPLFWVAFSVGVVLLLAFPFIPYNTFGEDVKVVKDSGLTLIMVLAIILALWTASVSIADEIEGRTALTLLSKPITRRQFIIGKFLGILGPVAFMFIALGAVFLATVSYKVVYEAKENSTPEPTVADCSAEMVQIVPGLVLAFLETVVLTSISVAISTRLPMLANLLICSAVYALGHLVPLLVQSPAGQFEVVRFVGQLISVVLPVLDHFNIQAAVATGSEVPVVYLIGVFAYCALYSTIAILVALILFEDRDLA